MTTTDIVDRLRAEYREWGEAFHAEAAAEIDRLRGEIEPLQKALETHAHYAAEVERLRAVLHEIKRCNAQYNFGSKLVRIVDTALEKIEP